MQRYTFVRPSSLGAYQTQLKTLENYPVKYIKTGKWLNRQVAGEISFVLLMFLVVYLVMFL